MRQAPEEDLSGNDKEVLESSQNNGFVDDKKDESSTDHRKDDDTSEHATNDDVREQEKLISQEEVVDEPQSN